MYNQQQIIKNQNSFNIDEDELLQDSKNRNKNNINVEDLMKNSTNLLQQSKYNSSLKILVKNLSDTEMPLYQAFQLQRRVLYLSKKKIQKYFIRDIQKIVNIRVPPLLKLINQILINMENNLPKILSNEYIQQQNQEYQQSINQQNQNEEKKQLIIYQKQKRQFNFYAQQLFCYTLDFLKLSYCFYKLNNQIQTSFLFLQQSIAIIEQIQHINHQEIQQKCGRNLLLIGNQYLQQEQQELAIKFYQQSYDHYINSLQYYLQFFHIQSNDKITVKLEIKCEKIVQQLVILLCNWGLACEQIHNYSKMNECLLLSDFLSRRLLIYNMSSEIKNFSSYLLKITQQKYQRHINELKDIYKLSKIFYQTFLYKKEEDDINQQNISNHMNNIIYQKFDYQSLNQSMFIVLNKEDQTQEKEVKFRKQSNDYYQEIRSRNQSIELNQEIRPRNQSKEKILEQRSHNQSLMIVNSQIAQINKRNSSVDLIYNQNLTKKNKTSRNDSIIVQKYNQQSRLSIKSPITNKNQSLPTTDRSNNPSTMIVNSLNVSQNLFEKSNFTNNIQKTNINNNQSKSLKVLTNQKYFKTYEDIAQEEQKILTEPYPDKYISYKFLDLRQPEIQKQRKQGALDLNYVMQKIVEEKISKVYPNEEYYTRFKQFLHQMKKEDFDRKEFTFAHKQVRFKKKQSDGKMGHLDNKQLNIITSHVKEKTNIISQFHNMKNEYRTEIQNRKPILYDQKDLNQNQYRKKRNFFQNIENKSKHIQTEILNSKQQTNSNDITSLNSPKSNNNFEIDSIDDQQLKARLISHQIIKQNLSQNEMNKQILNQKIQQNRKKIIQIKSQNDVLQQSQKNQINFDDFQTLTDSCKNMYSNNMKKKSQLLIAEFQQMKEELSQIKMEYHREASKANSKKTPIRTARNSTLDFMQKSLQTMKQVSGNVDINI